MSGAADIQPSNKANQSSNRKQKKPYNYRYHQNRRTNNQNRPQDDSNPNPPLALDPLLPSVTPDPRDPTKRITSKSAQGRNTESFQPESTLVRPDLRVKVGSNTFQSYPYLLKHDDVLIVPELFGKENDWGLYYELIEEITELQTAEKAKKGVEWIPWHEGAHLITKNPTGSKTFDFVINRLCDYFRIEKESVGTRFNWYRDGSDWKPFHHDSAAFNPQRAEKQNITVGVSFGCTRELAFLRAVPYETGEKCRIYFPQTNNGVFSFGRDVNILWKHGINAIPPEEQDGKGRISIVVWGLAKNVIEEEGSPPMLGLDGKGPHASKGRRDDRHGGGRRRGKANGKKKGEERSKDHHNRDNESRHGKEEEKEKRGNESKSKVKNGEKESHRL